MHSILELRQLYLSFLKENEYQQSPQGLYEPVNYIMQLGGKRMRPVLLLMAMNLFEEEVKKGLPGAHAIEVFHNFSLVHDDIMDAADLRRGKPTVHKKYDENTGILSGDAMLVLAYSAIAKLPIAIVPQALNIFNDTALGVCEGQQYDMEFETRSEVALEEYIKMITLKTAVLLEGAMKIGALAAGGTESDQFHIGSFARKLGIAFQIQDDILDTFGDPEKFGKRIGGDIVNNKKTLLVIKAQELATEPDQKLLGELMSTTEGDEELKIETVRSIFERSGSLAFAQKLKAEYQAEAMDHLTKVEVAEDRKGIIRQFSADLFEREV